ncbi:MAG: DotI/IcmL family type IV secretion protein [Legionella longbeachae]|nr:DotI/IcmL family type IV secretion protein [Legionella longbeachae]
MKNTILWSTLAALIGTQVHADITQPVTPPTPAPNGLQATPAAPTTPNQNIPSVQPAQTAEPVIDCEYKISAETKQIDQSLIMAWSAKAVTQAFDFDPDHLDMQLQKLQACFTEQGWTGFNTALQKSGNLQAIKSQKLTVSSQVDGQIIITEAKDNQWKINLPLQVVYQNDKEKVTQVLTIDLTVGRKLTGDLGITQMIAAPRGTITQEKSANPANNGDNNSNPLVSPKTTTPTPTTPETTTNQPISTP